MSSDATEIWGEEALAGFRNRLTPTYAFELLRGADGRLLIQLPVGVGKSRWLVDVVIAAIQQNLFDLVVVLAPLRGILEEIRRQLPGGLNPLLLEPRPQARCGPLNESWQQLEQAGCGALARHELCGTCRHRNSCNWPSQLRSGLGDRQVILATHTRMAIDPFFVDSLQSRTGAARVLTLVDESSILMRRFEQSIAPQELEQFRAVNESAARGNPGLTSHASKWRESLSIIGQASSTDLREGSWQFPIPEPAWALEVQRLGRDRFGQAFRFLAFELRTFARSDIASRERTAAGSIRFAGVPHLGSASIIFSGSIATQLVRFRLDPDHADRPFLSPFENYRFRHPGTRWVNLMLTAGAAQYFLRNSPQILDFFAELIARNICEGKRTLLIARKRFVEHCRTYLTSRLRALGVDDVTILTDGFEHAALQASGTVALINYGISGVNCFEHFDAAYCLSGYYIDVSAVRGVLHDLGIAEDRYPVNIHFDPASSSRRVAIDLPENLVTDLPAIAQQTLVQLEADVIVQAVGRVRPFTRPREVITMHCGELPGVEFTFNFRNLEQARAYFEVPNRRSADRDSRAARAQALAAGGMPRSRIAEEMAVSTRTVRRYINRQGGR